jgi:hypothetical protein
MQRPNFTGAWKFNPARSALEILAPQASTFAIDHQDPEFRISRTFVFDGRSDTFELSLRTDGSDVTGEHGGRSFRSRLFWDGDTLVLVTALGHRGADGENVVRYTLAGHHGPLVADERFRSRGLNYQNRWIFDREEPRERAPRG